MKKVLIVEDDKEIMEKFTAESNKVINRWSQGGATFAGECSYMYKYRSTLSTKEPGFEEESPWYNNSDK